MTRLPWERRAPRVLVVLPAHDEAESVRPALASVKAALVVALRHGVVSGADVVLAAHRCTDDTAAIARSLLTDVPGGRGVVLVDETSTTVGEVRDRAVREGLRRLRGSAHGRRLRETWLLSTDADSRVPLHWVSSLLDPAAEDGAVAVAGMVELVDWDASPAARAHYERILEAGMVDARRHRHVYAANLAVRLDAYLAVGGFVPRPHGEEQGLVDALAESGYPVTSSRASVVRTSGRMPGRAAAGLGALLGRLAEEDREQPDPDRLGAHPIDPADPTVALTGAAPGPTADGPARPVADVEETP